MITHPIHFLKNERQKIYAPNPQGTGKVSQKQNRNDENHHYGKA